MISTNAFISISFRLFFRHCKSRLCHALPLQHLSTQFLRFSLLFLALPRLRLSIPLIASLILCDAPPLNAPAAHVDVSPCRCLSKLRLASIAIAFPIFSLLFHCSSEPCFAMPLQVSSNHRIAVATQVASSPSIALAFLSKSSLCRCRSTPSAAQPYPAIAVN